MQTEDVQSEATGKAIQNQEDEWGMCGHIHLPATGTLEDPVYIVRIENLQQQIHTKICKQLYKTLFCTKLTCSSTRRFSSGDTILTRGWENFRFLRGQRC